VISRIAAVTIGALLIVVAFASAFHVADSREGLVAEVITLMSGLAGIGLLIYGLVPKRSSPPMARSSVAPRRGPRTANDLLIGAAGLLLAAVLLAGLVVSGGWLWAALGGMLLLPMLIGCTYMVAAFLRDTNRQWRIDLKQLTGR
jgi:hypothetical protein